MTKAKVLLLPLMFLALIGAKENCQGKREIKIQTSDHRVLTTKNVIAVNATNALIIRKEVWPKFQETVATAYIDGVISENISNTFSAIDKNVFHTGNLLIDAVDLWAIATINGDELKASNAIKLIFTYSDQLANLLKSGVDLAIINGVDVPKWNDKQP